MPAPLARQLRVDVDVAVLAAASDAAYLEHLDLPNVRRVGGVAALERVVRRTASAVEIGDR